MHPPDWRTEAVGAEGGHCQAGQEESIDWGLWAGSLGEQRAPWVLRLVASAGPLQAPGSFAFTARSPVAHLQRADGMICGGERLTPFGLRLST